MTTGRLRHRAHRLKVAATISDVQAFMALQARARGFGHFVWLVVNGQPLKHQRRCMIKVPTQTAESDAMIGALKIAGFKVLGATLCHAFMQASGLVNDHLISCPGILRWHSHHAEVRRLGGSLFHVLTKKSALKSQIPAASLQWPEKSTN